MEVAFNWLTAIRKCCYVNYFLIPKENWFFFFSIGYCDILPVRALCEFMSNVACVTNTPILIQINI